MLDTGDVIPLSHRYRHVDRKKKKKRGTCPCRMTRQFSEDDCLDSRVGVAKQQQRRGDGDGKNQRQMEIGMEKKV